MLWDKGTKNLSELKKLISNTPSLFLYPDTPLYRM